MRTFSYICDWLDNIKYTLNPRQKRIKKHIEYNTWCDNLEREIDKLDKEYMVWIVNNKDYIMDIRTLLSLSLYYLGDFISHLFFKYDCLAYRLYKPYNKIMTLSFKLDKDKKVWKSVYKDEEL